MPPANAQQLGRYIERHREAKGLSIRAVAKAAGVAPVTILRMERGDFESPAPQKLLRLARVLEVPVEDLYALAGYTMPEGLPDFGPYLRAKFDLPDTAIRKLDEQFRVLRERYVSKEKGGRRGKRSR